MHALGWQSLVTVFGLLIGAFYLSSPSPEGFPSKSRPARFAREIAFSTLIAIYTYFANGGSRDSNEGFDFVYAVEYIFKATGFCMPSIPYIMFSYAILLLVNSLINLAFCKFGSKNLNVIILSALTIIFNMLMLVHILELQISSTECKLQ